MTAKEELFDYLQKHVHVVVGSDEPTMTMTITRTIDLTDKICAALDEENLNGIRFMCEEATKLSDSDLNESGLMHVPLDMNGEQVHFGDRVHFCGDGQDFTVNGFLIKSGSNGWWAYEYPSRQYQLHSCTLVRKPTVKDLLLEMYDRLDEPSGDDQDRTSDEIIAEYVEKLRLKEE